LAGTACQPISPKPENVSVEPGSLTGTVTGAGAQLDPNVLRLKEQLSLTEQQTNQLNEIFQDTNAQKQAINAQRAALQHTNKPNETSQDINAQRAVLRKQMIDLQKKKAERINAVLTPEQAKKYEQIRSNPPEVMGTQPH
jgi:Spy/CpxP family protein refolding chaperone